ncbi:hypothetical protein [Parageobacillus toebii]|uniref:hypothetical protein n=1 Tax=Parageobacillus toebii TaxID=153151 RepID=UPI002E21184B|nr:hypothetical protein [Parageobacillus toebii]
MNEKGYSLVVTLLIITIFFILGLTILSVAIYQARFTEVRVEDVESLHEATQAIEETIAEMKVRIDDFELSAPEPENVAVPKSLLINKPEDLDNQLDDLIGDLEQRYGVNIEDVTKDYGIDQEKRKKLFTRVYTISYDIKDKDSQKTYKTVERRVILTNTPSFLKYAIGSTKDVILNGGAYIDGNIYAGGNAYVTNVANYIDNSKKYMEQTSFPTTSKTSVLFVNGSYYSCDHENGARTCYNIADNYFQRLVANYSNDVRFQSQAPSIQKEREEFIDVDFEWTVKDKLLNAAGIETFSQEYETYIDKSISQLFHELQDRFAVFDSVSSLQENIDSTNQSIILQSEDSPLFFLDQGELDLQEKWLIVNGDLFLGNSVDKSTKVRGNIIVLGNLTISGDIELDSTIYVFGRLDSPNVPGRTLIYNANIAGWDDKEVVLLSKGRLEIARINEFENNFSQTPNLKGYFYTESNATVYAVGSYINIEGGLFARGDTSSTAPDFDVSGLVINAYRGQVDRPNRLSFTQSNDIEQSRFVIRHDKSVFINRGEGLPFVKKLSLVVDKLIVK